MKVILLKDVAKIGRKHTIVEVPDGYARNQLIPKGMAKLATDANLKDIQHVKAGKDAAAKNIEDRFFQIREVLKDKVIQIKGLKSDKGHLFAALKVELIQSSAKEQGVEIDPGMIKLNAAIKQTGEHQIELSHGNHKATFTINVE